MDSSKGQGLAGCLNLHQVWLRIKISIGHHLSHIQISYLAHGHPKAFLGVSFIVLCICPGCTNVIWSWYFICKCTVTFCITGRTKEQKAAVEETACHIIYSWATGWKTWWAYKQWDKYKSKGLYTVFKKLSLTLIYWVL